MRTINPFTPTFGQVPRVMAGRDMLLNDMAVAFENGVGDPNLATILVGARGTGKTALMTSIAADAESRGWVSASVSAVPGMLQDIVERTRESAAHLLDTGARPHIKAFGIAPLANIEWDNPQEPAGNWRTQMNGLLDQLAKTDTGLLITVDEVRSDLDEMVQLSTVYQHFVREGRKVAILMAGLPHKVSSLLEDQSASFLRRARRHRLGRVPDREIRDAFEKTVADGGREIASDALDLAVDAIDGFPFMMQLVGYRVWAVNPEGAHITANDARRGIELARCELEDGVLETTFNELSKGDRRFLGALLACGEGATLSQVSDAMGVRSNYASQYKRRLMEQGIVGESGGKLRFDMPYFEDYLRERL